MSSYFPLLPNFYSIKHNTLIDTSISLANFPNNILMGNHSFNKDKTKPIFYYIYYLDNNIWNKFSSIKCEYGELIEIKRSSIEISNQKVVVILPSHSKDLPEKSRCLPTPISLKKDNSLVADRCSYNFFIEKFISSYQGEYPYRLATSEKGSFFSFDSLNLSDKEIESYLYLVNININSKQNIKDQLYFYNQNKKKLIKKVDVMSNTISILNMNDISLLKDSEEDLTLITCKSISFIPIFINILKTNSEFQISVEHTHPPTEFFWGKEKFKAANKLKREWTFKI